MNVLKNRKETMSIAPVSNCLKLNEWWNPEFRISVLRPTKFFKIEGLPEYKVTVTAMDKDSDRFVCKVGCYDTNGNYFERWVDEVTGQFYTMEGKCLTSDRIRFVYAPVPTGRKVPSTIKREIEGRQKALLYRYGVEDE